MKRLRLAAIGLSLLLLVVFAAGVFLIPRWAQAPAWDAVTEVGPKPKPCAPRVYPPESLQAGEQGVAWVRYSTGPDGAVIAADVLRSSGSPRLDAASLQHIRTCKFRGGGFSGTLLYKWVPP